MKDVFGGGVVTGLSSTAVVIAALLLGCQEAATHRADHDSLVDPLAVAKAVPGTLHVVDERGTRNLTLSEILPKFTPRIVVTLDPYYQSTKRFVAVPLGELLKEFWPGLDNEPHAEIEFAAADGYKVRLSAKLAQSPPAFIALRDVDHPPFEPISDRKADPSPLYLFWEGKEWTNLETHPRPWGIVTISKVHSGQGLQHVTPPHGFGADGCAEAGFRLFSAQCQRCHAINGEGGRLGPDLNVPRNILEYRSEPDVRAYIKDPATFRYGNMPAHPLLTTEHLDQLVCYLREMGRHKFDPRQPAAKTEKGS